MNKMGKLKLCICMMAIITMLAALSACSETNQHRVYVGAGGGLSVGG